MFETFSDFIVAINPFLRNMIRDKDKEDHTDEIIERSIDLGLLKNGGVIEYPAKYLILCGEKKI